MRRMEDFRNRLLQRLHGALMRPGMYGDQDGVQLVLLNLLGDLVYIDERESELELAYSHLEARGMWSATRLIGPFCRRFSRVDSFEDEIASVFAEIAHGLGFLQLDRTLTKSEWNDIRRGARQICRERDWHLSQIKERFGSPSLVIGGSWHQVHCYASTTDDGWVFFDYANEWLNTKPARLRFEDCILRSVRLPTPQFGRGVVYTQYGRQLK